MDTDPSKVAFVVMETAAYVPGRYPIHPRISRMPLITLAILLALHNVPSDGECLRAKSLCLPGGIKRSDEG